MALIRLIRFCDVDESESTCPADCAVGPGASVIAARSLRIGPAAGGDITLTWGHSCLATDTEYEVYEGKLGDFTLHEPRLCATDGQTEATFTPRPEANTYYLVVPANGLREGSYGTDSDGNERAAGIFACRPRTVDTCP